MHIWLADILRYGQCGSGLWRVYALLLNIWCNGERQLRFMNENRSLDLWLEGSAGISVELSTKLSGKITMPILQ